MYENWIDLNSVFISSAMSSSHLNWRFARFAAVNGMTIC